MSLPAPTHIVLSFDDITPGTSSGDILQWNGLSWLSSGLTENTPYRTGAKLRFYNSANTFYNQISASSLLAANVSWTLPVADGTAGQTISTNGSGQLGWTSSIATIGSSTANGIVRWNGTGGTAVKNSTLTLSDANVFSVLDSASYVNASSYKIGNALFLSAGTDSLFLGAATGLAGSQCVFVGAAAGQNNSVDYTTAIGAYALQFNTIGIQNTAVGYMALYSSSLGYNNTAVGYQALATSNSSNNVAVGTQSLFNTSIGTDNTAVGNQSMSSNDTGVANTALGSFALYSSIAANNNTAIGYSTGQYITGNNNTVIGSQSGILMTTGTDNVILGFNSGGAITTTSYNIILGSSATCRVTDQNTQIYKSSAGSYTLPAGRSGSVNFVTGTAGGLYIDCLKGSIASNVLYFNSGTGETSYGALPTTFMDSTFYIYDNADATKRVAFEVSGVTTSTTRTVTVPNADIILPANFGNSTNLMTGINTSTVSGSNNTGYGISALSSDTTGYENTAMGQQALFANTTGYDNTAIGYNAIRNNTIGLYNVGLGFNVLSTNINGSYNISIGANAMRYAANPSNNVAIGVSAGLYAAATGQVIIGYGALSGGTPPGANNTVIGYLACSGSTAANLTAVGFQALTANTSGTLNTAIGYSALASNNTGTSNTALGYQSLTSNTTGGFNTALGYVALAATTTVSDLTAIGANALNANTSGASNVAVGSSSLKFTTTGSFNTGLGTSSLFTNVSGSNNTAIGYQACRLSTVDSLTAVGYQALTANTTGTNNVAMGYQALTAVTTGGNNTAYGYSAASTLTTGTNNTYFGANTVASGVAVTNENVFGYATTGLGSNTATYGNASITKHVFQAGSVGIGLTGPGVPLAVYNASTAVTYDLVNFKTEYVGSSFAETRLTLAKGVFGGAISGYIINGASSGLVFYTISSGTYTENMRLSNNNLNIPTGTLSVGTTGAGPRVNVLIGTSYDSTNIGRGLQICGAATNGQYISLVQFGVASWSIGYVYNTNKFAIGAGNATDSSFTNPVFTISGTTIGINNPSPTYSLDVTGTGRFTSTLFQNGAIDTTAAALSATDTIAYTFYNFKPATVVVSKNGGGGNYVMVGVSGKFIQNAFYTSASTTHLEVDPSVDGTGTGASHYIAVSYGLRIKTGLYVNDVRTLYNLYVDAPAKGASTATVAVAAYLANLSVGYTGVDLAGTNNIICSGNFGAGTNAPLYGIDVASSLRIRSTATFLPLGPIDISTATPSSGDIFSWSFWNLAPTTITFLRNGGNGDYNFINLSGTATQAIFYYSNSWTYLNINPIVNGGADGGTNYLKNSYSLRIRAGTYTHEVRNIYNLYVEAPAAGTTFGSPVKQAAYLANLSVGYTGTDLAGTNNILCAGNIGVGTNAPAYGVDVATSLRIRSTATFLPLGPIDISTATPSSGDIVSWSLWNLAPTTITFLKNGGNGDYNFINLSGTATQAIFYYSNSWTYLNINPIVNGGADGGTNYLKNSYSLRIRAGTYTHEVRNIYNLYVEAPAAGTTFGSPVKQAAYLENLSVGYPTIDMTGTNNIICAGKIGIGIVPTTYQLDLSLDTARKLTTTTWTTGSDVRIKRNITSLDGPSSVDVIDRLNPVEYQYEEKYATEYKIDDNKYFGFIADEVQQVLPECVTVSDNELIPISDEECDRIFGKYKRQLTSEEKNTIDGYINHIKMLNPHNIQVYHLAATKELIKENKILKDKLAAMETQFTPESSIAAGTPGQIRWDTNFIYLCIAANTWKRTALTSF